MPILTCFWGLAFSAGKADFLQKGTRITRVTRRTSEVATGSRCSQEATPEECCDKGGRCKISSSQIGRMSSAAAAAVVIKVAAFMWVQFRGTFVAKEAIDDI